MRWSRQRRRHQRRRTWPLFCSRMFLRAPLEWHHAPSLQSTVPRSAKLNHSPDLALMRLKWRISAFGVQTLYVTLVGILRAPVVSAPLGPLWICSVRALLLKVRRPGAPMPTWVPVALTEVALLRTLLPRESALTTGSDPLRSVMRNHLSRRLLPSPLLTPSCRG